MRVASPRLSTNQPSPAGVRPDSVSSRWASSTMSRTKTNLAEHGVPLPLPDARGLRADRRARPLGRGRRLRRGRGDRGGHRRRLQADGSRARCLGDRGRRRQGRRGRGRPSEASDADQSLCPRLARAQRARDRDRAGAASGGPGQEREIFDASEDAFQDHWGFVPHDYHEWRAWTVERPSFDPSLWLIARDGDEIAGISLCYVGEGEGWVGVLGVRRPWRKRGLGRALLLESLRELRRRGMPCGALGVDSENPTGATRLYERAGMNVVNQSDAYKKDIR